MKSEVDLINVIQQDEWMMKILITAKTLELADWWICAGFVRSKIWDVLHDFDERTPMADIDLIYFDSTNTDELVEKKLEEQLYQLMPSVPWSVKNQARMHIVNNLPPYCSAVDGIANFPETATAIGVKLDVNDTILLTAPHGINDAINLKVKPTPRFTTNKDLMLVYNKRVQSKNWKSIWNRIEITPL